MKLYQTIMFDIQSLYSGPGRLDEVNATLSALAADFESRNDAAIEALLTHSAAAAAAAVESAFAALPLPVAPPALEAAVEGARSAHLQTWRKAFGAYRGCDEFAAADSVLFSTFDAEAEVLDARNAAAVARLVKKALKAGILSFKAALDDIESPTGAPPADGPTPQGHYYNLPPG